MAEQNPSDRCRIVVAASGNGSNFQAVIDAVKSGLIPDSVIVHLFHNKKGAYARQRAEKADPPIPTTYFNVVSQGFQTPGERDAQKKVEARNRYDAALAQEMLRWKPDLIVLAGWMHVFTENFLEPLDAAGVRIINLHPALPGKYDGAKAIERAFQDFQDGKLENNKTGVMIHWVVKEVDRGDPIMTREVECLEGDTLETLEEKVHAVEHDLIVTATAQVVRDLLAAKRNS